MDRTEGISESLRQELIDRESERVREMLADRGHSEYGIGGMNDDEVSVLNTSNDGRYVEVVIPYTWTETKNTTTNEPNRTATPMEVTSDQIRKAVYFVNGSTIDRRGTRDR